VVGGPPLYALPERSFTIMRMPRVHPACSLLLLLAVQAPAAAQDQEGPAPVNTTRSVSAGADDDVIGIGAYDRQPTLKGQEHPDGSYAGVIPGASTQPPAAARLRKDKGAVVITWPGFQMRPDGSSRVFIQSTAPLEPQASAEGGKYLVRLPGARVASQVNRLPLDTRYFNTPVTRVSLNVGNAGATVLLDLRVAVTPQVSSERDATGYYFTYIELPKGSWLPGAEAAAAAVSGTTPAATAPAQAEPKPRAAATDVGVRANASANAEAESSAGSIESKASVRGRLSL